MYIFKYNMWVNTFFLFLFFIHNHTFVVYHDLFTHRMIGVLKAYENHCFQGMQRTSVCAPLPKKMQMSA